MKGFVLTGVASVVASLFFSASTNAAIPIYSAEQVIIEPSEKYISQNGDWNYSYDKDQSGIFGLDVRGKRAQTGEFYALFDAKNLNVSVKGTFEEASGNSFVVGLHAAFLGGKSQEINVDFGGDDTEAVNIFSYGASQDYVYGVLPRKCVTTGNRVGLPVINIKANNEVNISAFSGTGESAAVGVINDLGASYRAEYSGSQVNINSSKVSLNAKSESGYAYGVSSQNMTSTNLAEGINPASVNIAADTIFIEAMSDRDEKYAAAGLKAYSQGRINIQGSVEVHADAAIMVRGDSVVNINNADKKNVYTRIYGDIVGDYQDTTGVNSVVNVNLTGKESIWEGATAIKWTSDNGKPSDDLLEIHEVYVSLNDGASWVPTSVDTFASETSGVSGVSLNMLNINDGIINIKDAAQVVDIDFVSGTGGIVNVATEIKEDHSITVSQLRIGDVLGSAVPSLRINPVGLNSDDMLDVDGTMDTLRRAVYISNNNNRGIERLIYIPQGDVKGVTTQTIFADGTVSEISQAVNTKIDSLSSITAITTVQWRHETDDLTKRMGELRDSPAGIGSWVRLYGSEQEYGKQNVKQKSTSVQVGADYALGDWVVGGVFSYTDGSTDYADGTGDTKSYGIAAYGTWMADNGLFLDLIAKYSRLENDFEISNMKGSLDNNAYSLSAEFGWHFDVNDLVYVEPQAELTYGRIIGDDTTTSNGVKVEQDDYNALLGRIGLRAGLKFPDHRGSVYARLSGVYDFDGESSATYSKGGQVEHLKEDLGGGWVEYAVGANFNLTPNAYTYVDLERTSGGEVKEDWRWNVGFRYVF